MKVIYPVNIQEVEASTEYPEFPAVNLMDRHPKKIWRGIGNSGILTLSCSRSSGVALFHTNAQKISILVSQGQHIEWSEEILWADEILWDQDEDAHSSMFDVTNETDGVFWSEWAERDLQHTIELRLIAKPDEDIMVGVAKAGDINIFPDPVDGLEQGLKDYSIEKELNNGAFYYRKRDIVRTFAGEINMERNPDFYTFMHGIARENGKNPLAWRLITKGDLKWVVYARFSDLPSGKHSRRVNLNFTIIEVI